MTTTTSGGADGAPAPGTPPTPLSRARETIRRLRAELAARSDDRPVAVVGIGLRLPGAIDTLDGYWAALEQGRDLTGPIPAGRAAPFADEWRSLPGRGGFLDEVLGFDAAHFGISPREARTIDPQHRLLLEVASEALEDAALPQERLRDVRTGCYLGITHQDYRDWEPDDADAYWATGNGHCFAAGRVAYTLGLTGPAVAVDTACSSSLVALHQAGVALRRGECEAALVGGVNLILSPRSTRLLAREMGALAPDGLCKAFDARANGFTRGEGCAVLVLKRLDDALRDGDRVHAVIKGSAVNQDGRSSGFTAPNVLAQASLIGSALADARLTPADIGLIEAHGTGTALGDPIEMEALASALGRPKGSGDPLLVGAAKTNMGHLEAAAGVAGVVKAILSLRHGAVPPLVHFATLNPRIDLDGTGISLPTELVPWPSAAGRYAGVSSFGMSGTNAHVLLGLPEPAAGAPEPAPAEVTGFELSARTPGALRELAARYAGRLRGMEPEHYPAFAYTATEGRTRYACRARVEAADPESAGAALTALAEGAPPPAVTLADGDSAPPRLDLPRRVLDDLPHYPWQRKRYGDRPASGVTEPVAHDPLPLYRQEWEPLAPGEPDGSTVVIAGDDDELVGALTDAAEQLDMPAVVLDPPPASDAEWAAFWQRRPSGERVCLLLAMAARPLPDDPAGAPDVPGPAAGLCAAVTSAVGAMPGGSATRRVVVLTRAAKRVTGDDEVLATGHGALHGLAPGLGLEFAAWGGMVDLPATVDGADLRTLLRVLPDGSGEDLLAVRAGRAYTARLRPVPTGPDSGPDTGPLTGPPLRPDATYLVTGGLGGVGKAVAADLVRRGARHLLLIGRRAESELAPAAAGALDRLRAEGADVRYRAADCADADELGRALTGEPDLPAFGGVVHAAGTLARTPLTAAGPAEFAGALHGKFTGAWWLHLLLRDTPLDFFVLVSSVSAVWGADGYGAYAAANGGLDMIAGHRASTGAPAVSVACGPWAVDGMVDADDLAGLARGGVGALDAATGCAGLAAGAAAGEPSLICCPVEWPRFAAVMSARRSRALFQDLAAAPAAAPVGAPAADADAADAAAVPAPEGRAALLDLPELARPDAVRKEVAAAVARILGYPDPDSVRDGQGFFELGLDSMTAVDLLGKLTATYGVPLQVSDVFDHPTVADLATLVLARLADPAASPPPPAASPPPPAPVRPATSAPVSTPPEAAPQETEPVAIVGMAGRFPGADSVEEFWRLLLDGRDGVGPVPPDRWDAAALHGGDAAGAGTITTDRGGFLSDIARFDAGFFEIPAREAESMDPQHRLLLETSWHALEDAGIGPTSLRGTPTGVFVGISNSDYARILERGGLGGLDAYYGTGTSLNAAAGRISYVLGLRGPALAVDTACSSSLVAVHLALRSLRAGESETALVGGVNVIAAPAASVAVSRAHMLSPDGSCKTFSAEADGFVRSEAVGVLVLKPLRAARRDGDRVLAVLHGSAVNSDGASSGLTAPSGTAQEAVITGALADAGISGSQVSFLETHGTGTALGDPVEVAAAWRALGPGRDPGEPLHLGAVKSNVGHCESAAGMVSLIKTVLALRHERLPGNLHCAEPNPRIDWDGMNVRAADAHTAWPAGGRERLAGVSGFGFSGTNAHVIVGAAPDRPPSAGPAAPVPVLLPVSAAAADALDRQSAAWAEALAEATDDELPALAGAAGAGRAHLPVRRAVLGGTAEELRRGLGAPARRTGRTRAPRVAFLFSGQGSQYFGMGRELYETEPAFRERFDACDEVLAPHLGASLRDLIWYGADRDRLDQTGVTQPALVALELSLAALWEAWGVTASAVLGHSVGEVAAAIHAGVLDERDGLTLIAHRARLMQATEPGAMLAVTAPADRVTGWLAGTGLDLAAINGPRAVVVAGPAEEVEEFAAARKAEGVTVRGLAVSRAFHSRLMEPVLPELGRELSALEPRAPVLPLVANLSGRVAAPGEHGARYWCRHVREPVRFQQGVEELRALDADVFLEIGPGRTLAGLVHAADLAPPGGALASLRRGVADRRALLEAVRDLYEQGQDVRWEAVQPRSPGGRTGGPRYPFAGTRFWTPVAGHVPASAGPAVPADAAAPPAGTPHWGRELRSPALTGRVFEFPRSARFPAHLTDHRLYGGVVAPAASHLATVLSVLGPGGRSLAIGDLLCPRALVIAEDERYDVQLVLDDGGRRMRVHSRVDPAGEQWQEHLDGRAAPGAVVARPGLPDRDAFIAGARRHIDGARFYEYFHGLGYTLGPSFRWIADLWIDGDEALVRYTRPVPLDDPDEYEIQPGLIDSCFQSIAGFLIGDTAEEAPSLAIPFAAARLGFPAVAGGRPGDGELWGHVRVRSAAELPGGLRRVESADLHMFTADGTSLLVAEDFRVRHAPRDLLRRSTRDAPPLLYAPAWTEAAPDEEPVAAACAVRVTGPAGGLADAVTAALRDLGHDVVTDPADPADLIMDLGHVEPGADATARDAAFRLTEALRASPPGIPYAVVCRDEPAAAPVRETLWGLLAAVEAEQPHRRLIRVQLSGAAGPAAGPHPPPSGGRAPLDASVAARLAAVLTRAVRDGVPETRLRLDADRTYLARLEAVSPSPPGVPSGDGLPGGVADDPPGGVLITGGLGALGLSVARILAARGVRAITFMGRSEPGETARRVLDELVERGVRTEVVRGDAADPDDCGAAVAAAVALGPLQAVLHLAGAASDGAFDSLTGASFDEVFAGKADGARHLAAALDGHEPASFLLFSSVSSVLGAAGQANYAAANGHLNGLAMALRARGVPATSVCWGPWEPAVEGGPAGGGGMAAGRAARAAAARVGVHALTDTAAAPLLAAAMASPAARLVAVDIDVPRYLERAAGHPRAALLADLADGAAAAPDRDAPSAAPGPVRPSGWLRAELDGMAAAERADRLRDVIAAMVGEALGDPAAVDETRGFAELGLDSIMVIDLRANLQHGLGLDLPATVALDHPTVPAMAAYIGETVAAGAGRPGGNGDRPGAADGFDGADGSAGQVAEPADLSLEELVRAVRDDLAVES